MFSQLANQFICIWEKYRGLSNRGNFFHDTPFVVQAETIGFGMTRVQQFSLEPTEFLGKCVIYYIFMKTTSCPVNYESGYWYKVYCYHGDHDLR